MVEKEYLYFEEQIPNVKRKTKMFVIKNKQDDTYLGDVEWNNGWRRYCFYPDLMTYWSSGCLKQVYNFIDKLMEERKNSKT